MRVLDSKISNSFLIFERFCFENGEKWFVVAKPLGGGIEVAKRSFQIIKFFYTTATVSEEKE